MKTNKLKAGLKVNKGKLRSAIASAKSCAKASGKSYQVVNSSFQGVFDCDVLPYDPNVPTAKVLFQTDGKFHIWSGPAMDISK